MSTRDPRSINTLSVVVGTVSVVVEPQEKSQTLCPLLQRSYHLSSMGNKQGLAIHHAATNHDKFWVKTKVRNTVLISQQQQQSSLLGRDFPRSMESLWSSDPLGWVILSLPLRRPILLHENDVMPLCSPNNIVCLQYVSLFPLPKYIIDFHHFYAPVTTPKQTGTSSCFNYVFL